MRNGGAQVGNQAVEHGAGLRRARAHQRAHVGERVEQEMRLHLRLQQTQARVARAALELAAFQLEAVRQVARESLALPQHRRERDPGSEQHADEAQLAVADLAQPVVQQVHVAAGRQPVREIGREGHRQAHAQHLQHPACEPARQPRRPLLEHAERELRAAGDDERALDPHEGARLRTDADQQPEQQRHGQREAHARPREDAGEAACGRSGGGHGAIVTLLTCAAATSRPSRRQCRTPSAAWRRRARRPPRAARAARRSRGRAARARARAAAAHIARSRAW